MGANKVDASIAPASTAEQLLLEIMAYPTRLPIDDMAGFPMEQSKAALSLV
ncbi:hypothetical protein [Sphingopyxis sp. Root1497]|uniref:hypothetical protein n=1 Tax=Sphingopyxis sp. Root1497 TaxID=1736474 RepID=UPI00138ECA86|nr:hypothetical protein [Sphingopyxis sp. Root1497]